MLLKRVPELKVVRLPIPKTLLQFLLDKLPPLFFRVPLRQGVQLCVPNLVWSLNEADPSAFLLLERDLDRRHVISKDGEQIHVALAILAARPADDAVHPLDATTTGNN